MEIKEMHTTYYKVDDKTFNSLEEAQQYELALEFHNIPCTRIDIFNADVYTINSREDLDRFEAYVEYYDYQVDKYYVNDIRHFPQYLAWKDNGDAFFISKTLYDELVKYDKRLEETL